MSTKLIPRVVLSLENLFTGPQGQRGIKFDTSSDPDIVLVFISGVGHVPAIVALRLALTRREMHAQNWGLTVAPYESGLLTRLLGRPSGCLDDVSYSIVKELKYMLSVVAVCEPEPPEGTVIQATFRFNEDGQPLWDLFISTIEDARARRIRDLRHNEIALAKSFGYGWLRKLFKWGLLPDPGEPKFDQWALEHCSEIESAMMSHVLPALMSLWRAVFSEGNTAKELKSHGYNMDAIGQTNLGKQELREVLAGARDHSLTVITHMD
jgi:hypothetical protein